MKDWYLAFFEFAVVLAFVVGWMILEWQCRRLDRLRQSESDESREPTPNDEHS